MNFGVPLSDPNAAALEQVARVELTPMQKLTAISHRFYGRQTWNPQPGDFYTTSRADMELYQVVSVDETTIKTRYVDPQRGDTISEWERATFLSPETFGYARVWVPAWVLRMIQ